MIQKIIDRIIGPDSKNQKARARCGNIGGIFGMVGNFILFVIKLIAGLLSGSMSITADAFNNLSDMGSSVVTILGFKIASKPADREHPFGHGRMEYMSAMFVSVLIIIVGFELFSESFIKLKNPLVPETTVLTFVILIASIIIKLLMGVFNNALGKKINSSALKASATDCFNDCISTSAVLVVTLVCRFFGHLSFVKYLDTIAGLIVSAVILIAGVKSIKETMDPLIGIAPEKETVNKIKDIVMSDPDFLGIHDMIVHNYGPGRSFVSLHVEVPTGIDILFCHEKIDACERDILDKTGIQAVIHMDPIVTDDETVNFARSQMSKRIVELHEGLSLHDFRMVKGEKQNNLIFDICVPADCSLSEKQLREAVSAIATDIDKTYNCVITIDSDFSGGH